MKYIKSNFLFFFVLSSIVLRLHSFFPSVLNQDESTYLIIAQKILEGQKLYVETTDTKPVGIFLVYSFLQGLLGYSIFLKRLVVAIIVGITSVVISKVSLKLFKDENSSLAAGFIYILYTSTWKFYGLSPNTELFFNLFTISGLFLLLNEARGSNILAGLLFGIGFIIKYLVLFDFIALVGFFMIWDLWQSKWKIKTGFLMPYLGCGLAFALPFALVNIYFFMGDHFDSFAYVSYVLPVKYINNSNDFRFFQTLGDFAGRFVPITIILIYVISTKQIIFKGWKRIILFVWGIVLLFAIWLQGKGFLHYMVQLMLPLSLIAGLFFHPELKKGTVYRYIYQSRVGRSLMVGFVCIAIIAGVIEIHQKEDTPKRISSYLDGRLNDGDVLYSTHVYYNAVYYLLKMDSPSVYVHNTANLFKAFGVDEEREMMNIIEQNPRFIITKNNYPKINAYLKKHYTLEETFENGQTKLYQYNGNFVSQFNLCH